MIFKKSYWLAVATLIIGIIAGRVTQMDKPCCAFNNLPPGKDLLSYDQAQRYVNNYAAHAGFVPVLAAGTDTASMKYVEDSRCVWFGVDRLRELLCQIEKDKGNGIRFYFATYDTSYDSIALEPTPPRDYWGRNTLVMVSTRDSLDYARDYFNDSTLGALPNGFMISIAPENKGELCPPPSNCYSRGALLLRNASDAVPDR
jgi:hypothetical protein